MIRKWLGWGKSLRKRNELVDKVVFGNSSWVSFLCDFINSTQRTAYICVNKVEFEVFAATVKSVYWESMYISCKKQI